jgi:hypothetical protein
LWLRLAAVIGEGIDIAPKVKHNLARSKRWDSVRYMTNEELNPVNVDQQGSLTGDGAG